MVTFMQSKMSKHH